MARLSLGAPAMAILLGLCLAGALKAQSPRDESADTRSRVLLVVEPVAVGIAYAHGVGNGWSLGAEAKAGPAFGVDISSSTTDRGRDWLAAYATIGYRSAGGLGVQLSPIGAAIIIGNDYIAGFPSAQASIEMMSGRLGVASLVRVVRIPVYNRTADYWTQWVPLRLSYRVL